MTPLALAIKHYLSNTNVQAFLHVIREGETTHTEDAYRWLFGSTKEKPKLFSSFADHPRVRTFEKYDGQFIKNGKLDFTTAAGAYQIVASTWDPAARALGLKDFTPESQDLAAVYLIKQRKALDDVLNGRIEQAIAKLTKEWASLPGANYGDQPTQKLAHALDVYRAYNGVFRAVEEPAPVTTIEVKTTPADQQAMDIALGQTTGGIAETLAAVKEKIMSPFVPLVLPYLIELVPKLARIFSSGSKVADRNVTAVETVVNIAKEAIGAANEQELVESIKNDPNAANQVKEAIETHWFKIEEVGGGVAAAREANMLYVEKGLDFKANPAFWISLALIAMPYLLLVDIFYVHPDEYEENLRTQIVTGILLVISMVGAYWLGTSHSSARKTDVLAGKEPSP